MAQDLPEDLVFGAAPAEPEQPDMAYQPPADADDLTDFLPPDGILMEAPPLTMTLPITPSAPVTPTLRAVSSAITLTTPITQLVSFAGGQVAVVFEQDTLTDTAEIHLTTTLTPTFPLTHTNTVTNPVDQLILHRFQLEVVQKGEVVSGEFSKPVRLILDMRPLLQQLDPTFQTWRYFLAYQDESDPDIWIEVPIDIYQADGLFSAEVTHFSNWAAGVRPERWNPSWTPPVVSSFSGAATFSYPVELPPGRNGLQPDVTLAYSSRALDGRIRDGESGPIGDGWSIGGISVVRVGVALEAPWGYPWSLHPDKFRLILNGAGHELFPVDPTGNPTVRYYVKDAPGYFLERNYSATGVPNVDGIYWILITPDGVRYRLGYFADAEEWQHSSHLNIQGHVGHANSYSAIAWHVDTVTDSFGNQMTYHYHTLDIGETIKWWNTDHWTSFTLTTRKNRINEIKYNYPTRVTSLPAADTVARLTATPATRITFRPSNTSNGDDQFLINSIFIYHGGGSLPVSEYRIVSDGVMIDSPGCINYDTQPNVRRSSHTRIVKSIQRFVNTDGDATTQDAGYALPPTTFYYGTNLNDLNSYNPLRHFEKNEQACFRFLYLQGYKNGYGGTVRFSYSSDNRSVGAYQYVGYDRYNWPQIGYTYSVNEMRINDGRNPDLRTTYAYTQPCYAQWGSVPTGAANCAEPNAPEEHGPLVGYQTTTQISYEYDGTTPRAKQVTTFSQDATNSIGRPLQIEVRNGGNTLLTRTNHTYNSLTINGLPNMFTYTSRVTNRQYDNGENSTDISTKTEYGYESANQGGAQYGNLTHIREFADANASVPHRVTIRHYATNTTGDYWLVAPVKAEGIYHDEGVTLIRGAWLHYDGNGSETGAPTQGALTRSRSFIPTLCSAAPNGGGVGCDNTKAYQTIETTYGYDVYGNQTSATTYNDYGYRTFDSSWQQLINTSPSSARATQITYESTYNLYPVSTTNPASQTTTFQIYGFGGVPAHQFNNYTTPAGLLKQVTGPDSVTTKYEYDPFGRLHAVYDGNTTYNGTAFAGFNDADPWNGDPVTLYRYWDNTLNNATTFLNPAGNAPFYISAQQRPGSFPAPANSSSGFAFNEQTFYDGFGRPIQTRSIWHWVEGYANSREIYATTAYGANGQVACQTAPYDVPFYSDSPRSLVWPASPFLNDPCTGKPHTATTYDALGRPLVVTAPDGTAATYAYYIVNTITVDNRNLLALTNVKDANNRIVQQFSNSLGQLALVRELTGDGSGGSPYVGDADTRYYYDLPGNLVKVKQSSASNADPATWLAQTTMAYDGFGRKTGMSDPDMGSWTYAYDAAGNLTRQKDGKNQAICFRYDGLNRLTIKAQDSTPADDCPSTLPTTGSYHLASYTYDTAVNGQGKVAQIAWGPTPTQNKDIFFYDTLGRMYKQDRYLDGRLYTMRTSSFDALHRPLTVVYPDNETVTYAYDREGENSLTAGTDQLVTNIHYNARGQMTYLDRHNVADTTFLYHPQTDLSGGGLGDSNFRLKTIQHDAAGSGDTWPDFTYEYDRVGNISKMTTVSTAGTDTQSFGYDHLNRLLTASAVGGVANYNHSYAYDKLGNIDYRVDSGNMLDYTYGAKPHAVTAVNASTNMSFTYDANGNMTRRIEGGATYNQVFDVENRIILVNPVTGGSTGFFYDAGGQRVKTLQPNGTLVYTPYPTYEEEVRPTILFQADFESGGEMSEIKSSSFPMSSLWRSNWGAAAPASGAHGYAFSNHAYGYVQSDAIAVIANTQYDLYAWVRGQLDPDDRAGAWLIRAYYYNSSGGGISYQDIASNQGSLTTTWQEKGGRITTPAGTATLRIQLYNYSNSGWVAFDDVRLNPVNGRNMVVNPGFESSSGWSGIASASFPGTSLWRGGSGPSAPRSGSYSYSISNLANGFLRSDAFAVTANTQYDLYAWVRGEIDPDEGTPVSRWVIRAQFFNSSGGSLGYVDADSGNPGSLNTTWRQEGGRITTPANTASVRIELYNYLNSGWVVFDDVTFIKVGTSVNLAPNPGFESSGGWGASPSSAFPGTSLWRSTWGISGPRSGANAYSISNHPYAYLQSASLPVTGGAQYDLYAWVRGKLDADDSASSFYLRLRFYDSSGALIPYDSGHNAHSGSLESLDGVWRYSGGRVTAPSNAATVQILLLNHFNTGWVTFDDVSLTRVGQETVIKRSSYGIAGQTIATRVSGDPVSGNNGISYFYNDHLGSNTALRKPDGSRVSTYYLPFGGYRPGSAPTQTITDRDFTGQRENMELGLLYYQARFYVPAIGRFASADTIVPDRANPQQYNRYTYTLNNPLRYSDPTGHCIFGIDTAVCVAALVGAGVSLIVDYGSQVIENVQDGMGWEAVYSENIIWRQTAVAMVSGSVGGAVAGPFAGRVGTSLVSKLAWYGLGGAAGGAVGGQAGALTDATWEEAASLLSGGGFDGSRFLDTAREAGFIDNKEIVVDAASGTVLAWAGAGLNAALSRALPHGLRPWQPEVPRQNVIKFTPTLDGPPRMYLEYEGRWVVVPPDRVALLLQSMAQGLVDVTSDIIIEAISANQELDAP